jgi:hypothetical protein
VYVTCRKVCSPDHQRPVGACVSPIKQTPWYVFLIYLSERTLHSRIIGGGSSVPSSLLVRNAHHVPAYDRIPPFPTRQSRVGHETTCMPLVLEKEFSGRSGETKSGEGATPSPLSQRLTSPGRDVLSYPLLMVVGVVEVQRKDPALPWPFAYSEQGYPGSREGKLARAAHKYFCAPLPSAFGSSAGRPGLLGTGLLQISQSALKRKTNAEASGRPSPFLLQPTPLQAFPHLNSYPSLAPSLPSLSAIFFPNRSLPHQSLSVSPSVGPSADDRLSQRT